MTRSRFSSVQDVIDVADGRFSPPHAVPPPSHTWRVTPASPSQLELPRPQGLPCFVFTKLTHRPRPPLTHPLIHLPFHSPTQPRTVIQSLTYRVQHPLIHPCTQSSMHPPDQPLSYPLYQSVKALYISPFTTSVTTTTTTTTTTLPLQHRLQNIVGSFPPHLVSFTTSLI